MEEPLWRSSDIVPGSISQTPMGLMELELEPRQVVHLHLHYHFQSHSQSQLSLRLDKATFSIPRFLLAH